MSTPLDPSFLQTLLNKPDEPKHNPHRPYIPPNSRVVWTDVAGLCDASEGRCLSESYTKIDGHHRCMMHALTDLIDIITRMENGRG